MKKTFLLIAAIASCEVQRVCRDDGCVQLKIGICRTQCCGPSLMEIALPAPPAEAEDGAAAADGAPARLALPSTMDRLLFNVSLSWNQARNNCSSSWAWWSHVNEHVMLGALPLASRDHLRALKQDEGVTAVLSLNMPHELGAGGRGTWFAMPVTPEEWRTAGIAHQALPTNDFFPPTPERIALAIEFIEEHVRCRGRVYVHCKAGRGRSAVIAACYLCKQRGLKPDDAVALLKTLRAQTNMGRAQRAAVQSFFEHELAAKGFGNAAAGAGAVSADGGAIRAAGAAVGAAGAPGQGVALGAAAAAEAGTTGAVSEASSALTTADDSTSTAEG